MIDLSQVTFIDSTALGVIIGGVKRLHERDGRLALVASSRPVVRILDITGLDRVLTSSTPARRRSPAFWRPSRRRRGARL